CEAAQGPRQFPLKCSFSQSRIYSLSDFGAAGRPFCWASAKGTAASAAANKTKRRVRVNIAHITALVPTWHLERKGGTTKTIQAIWPRITRITRPTTPHVRGAEQLRKGYFFG